MPRVTNLATMIASVRASITAKLLERNSHVVLMDEIRAALTTDNRDPSEDEATKLRAASDAKARIDSELDQLRARETELTDEQTSDDAAERLSREMHPGAPRPEGGATVTSEARTYSRDSERNGISFFADGYRATRGDYGAQQRINRHMQEVTVNGELSARATTTASFSGLVVPQYLIDEAALMARAGRPFANSVHSVPLPEAGMSLIIPRGTTGASVAIQASENTLVNTTDEVWTSLTLPVVTVAGQAQVSRQALERGANVDALIYADLVAAYAVAVDAQCLSGTGAAGQVLGVLNTVGVNQATAFIAAAVAGTSMTKIAGQISAVQTTRFLAPTAIAMHPRRFNWLISQVDSTGRPLVVPWAGGAFNAFGVADVPTDTPSVVPSGTVLGLPVVTDASIPGAVGTGPEDVVIVYRAADLLLFEEGDGMPEQLVFEQTLGNQLTTTIVAYGYIAFTAGRYPGAVGLVGGNSGAGFGFINPTF